MTFVLGALGLLCLYGIRFSKEGFSDFLSVEKTTCVKGIFVILVFFRHFKSYVTLDSRWDFVYTYLDNRLGQLIVVLFFFYSGYGLFVSYRKKGKPYIDGLLKNRFLKIWVHFDIAVVFYLLLAWALGTFYPLKQIINAFLAWQTVGNSNWYIWVTLLLYLFLFVFGQLFYRRPLLFLCAVTAATVAYIVIFYSIYPDYYWWCDTVLCFPAGLFYAYFESRIHALFQRKWVYPTALLLFAALFLFLFPLRDSLALYQALSLSFVALILLITKKVSFQNRILTFFGKRVFPFYILQHFPMILLSHFSLNQFPLLFLAASFGMTLLLIPAYERLLQKVDQLLFSPR